MKVPLHWLADHLSAPLPPLAELVERLAVGSSVVEGVHRVGLPDVDGNLGRVVAGLVIEAGKHPNADRLQLCRVDTGDSELRQIVCGAWNFGAGDTVAVAVPGALLPDGRKLERSRLRGEVSNGMILSERELSLSQEHGGILVLGDGYAPGEPLARRLPLADTVLELEITSNRGDLLSMRGVARDVGALFDIDLVELDLADPPATGDRATADWIAVASDDRELCPRFTAHVFTDVRVGDSPLWLKARLSAAGIRPIANVVDVTNYVMHDLGSPLHAYDHARIAGARLVARRAVEGERITTLDGKERVLTHEMLVISDAERAQGVAGIMGAANSEISADTTVVVLEAANFSRGQVMRTSWQLGLRTDGSNRWDKGVPPALAPIAAAHAARLIVELCGARMSPAPLDVCSALPERLQVRLRDGRVGQVTGVDVPTGDASSHLARLGFEPEADDGGVCTRVPHWRWLDVTREIDLVEEVSRIHGLDRVPSRLPSGARSGGLTPLQRFRRALQDAACGAGLDEAHTVSLLPTDWAGRLSLAPDDPRRRVLTLRQPLSAEHAIARPLLLPGLLASLARNVALGDDDAGLFEIGHVFRPRDGQRLPDEPWTLGATLCGRVAPAGWRVAGPEASLFQAKGILTALLASVGLTIETRPSRGADPFLHPGRAARVLVDGDDIGFVGELHPACADRHGLEGVVACFEVDVDRLAAAVGERPRERPVPDRPPLRQDIAVVVADEHAAADVAAAARQAGGQLLAGVEVFDVYADERALGAGRRSLALRLTFQSPDRTLTDDEVKPLRERIVAELRERFGAELRS